ncbi:hypothetical protein BDP81DRAFT_474713 [Colletotrichum phormii]|uniref:Amine oxidase domain-containing protein n=1 Tax=Colletotrichum phormii TaxID=359342 RepID=A0AAJ0ECV4_9PEZI|nr:uncharacterized protein BDP81DRAFT_474713 [Colletotrichum phormii]KAK1624992.1 hypothetical protein BDP81DRAFT_474713 [Colletotrichum phormii]
MSPNEPQPSGPGVTVEESTRPSNDSYKAQWARYVSRHKLQRDLQVASKRMTDIANKIKPTLPILNSVSALAQVTETATGGGLIPEHHGKFKVGIVGGGVAGLFTALLLDWLNKELGKQSGEEEYLDIDYDILEAAGEERLGGRLYTYRFSGSDGGVHDYYDVGAMRFPENDVMDRTFRLFKYLDIDKGALNDRKKPTDPPKLVPYSLTAKKQPMYFNDVRQVGNPWEPSKPTAANPFNLNNGVPECDQIPAYLLREAPGDLFEKAIEKYLHTVRRGLDDQKETTPPTPEEEEKFFNMLMLSDRMSVRQFLLSKENAGDIPDGPGYNYSTVQWIETATFGTGWYDQSLTEAILESLDFNTRDNESWWCVDGGAQRIADQMRNKIAKPNAIKFNTQVMAVKSNVQVNSVVTADMSLKVKDTKTDKPKEDPKYFTVFNSTTLGSMDRMDLSKAGLFWDTKQAIRCLGYGASCKVGMKFKTAWWRQAPYNITEGGLARTDLPLQVCVYPSYNVDDPNTEPNVLLVSYTWGQTAQRIASLIPCRNDPAAQVELRNVLIHDLTLLHADPSKEDSYNATRKTISENLSETHGYDWYRDPLMAGAFAFFGPCQFWDLYPAITKPNSFGQLYFIGEAASAHHAWVVGALESVVRAVWLMFDCLHQGSKKDTRPGHKGFAAYEKAMKLLEGDGPEKLPFYPLPAELPKRCTDRQETPTEDLIDHPKLDHQKEVPIMYGAALVALSLVESTLNEWAKPDVKVKF